MKVPLLIYFCLFALASLVQTQTATLAPYALPSPQAMFDRYFAELTLAVFATAPVANGSHPIQSVKFFVFRPEVFVALYRVEVDQDQLVTASLLQALLLDISVAIAKPTSEILVTPVAENKVAIRIETVAGQQTHKLLSHHVRGQLLLKRFTAAYNSLVNDVHVPTVTHLTQTERYRGLVSIELVDNEGGRGPHWEAKDILYPTVSTAIVSDLSNILAVKESRGKNIYPREVFILTATNLELGGSRHKDKYWAWSARRVALHVVIEGETPTMVARRQRALLGRVALPLTSGALQRTVHLRASIEGVIREDNTVPNPGHVCGPGCAVPAILWCLIAFLSAIIFWLAFGGSTQEEEEEEVLKDCVPIHAAEEQAQLPAKRIESTPQNQSLSYHR